MPTAVPNAVITKFFMVHKVIGELRMIPLAASKGFAQHGAFYPISAYADVSKFHKLSQLAQLRRYTAQASQKNRACQIPYAGNTHQGAWKTNCKRSVHHLEVGRKFIEHRTVPVGTSCRPMSQVCCIRSFSLIYLLRELPLLAELGHSSQHSMSPS